MTFVEVPPADLPKLLPNLPPAEMMSPERQDSFDLVTRLLTYEPTARLPAAHALGHPLFRRGLPLVLPPSLGGKPWQGRSLANVISQYIGSVG